MTLWMSVACEAGLPWGEEQQQITTTDPQQRPAQQWRFKVPRVVLDAAAVRSVGADL